MMQRRCHAGIISKMQPQPASVRCAAWTASAASLRHSQACSAILTPSLPPRRSSRLAVVVSASQRALAPAVSSSAIARSMAMLLEARLPATGAPLAPSLLSSSSAPLRLVAVTARSGLRITTSCRTQRVMPSSRSLARSRRGAIVCEAQETVTGVPGVVNESTWKSLVGDSDVPVLVDFWAPWCGPCRMIAPIIDEIAKKYAAKVRCLKLNTDESPNIATEYGIRSIPTVMVFVNGEKRDTVIGAVPMQNLTNTLNKYVSW